MSIFKNKIIPGLVKIAMRENNPFFLDTRKEKSEALRYLLAEWNKLKLRSDEVELFKQATDKLLSIKDHYLLVKPAAKPLDPRQINKLLYPVTYLTIAYEKIQKIAGRHGERHLVDSPQEKKEILKYLKSIQGKLIPCEQGFLDKSIEVLLSNDRLQIHPFYNFDLDNSLCGKGVTASLGRRLLGVGKPFFKTLPKDKLMTYKSTYALECACEEKGWGKGCCMAHGTQTITLTQAEWEKAIVPLKNRSTPKEERIALLKVLTNFPGFPIAEDCTHQARASIQLVWLISTAGYLKWHGFGPGFQRLSSQTFRHFASGVTGNRDNTLWVIDTWANVVLPYSSWTDIRLERR